MSGIISIDWLGMNVKNKYVGFRFSDKYTLKNLGINTRHFNCVEDIYDGKEHIASITHTPHKNSVVPPETIQLKFSNAFLYEENLRERVEAFLVENNLVFKSFSRFDICYDFNKFSNGWTGLQFVKKFSKTTIERKAHGHYTISGRKGENGRNENYLAFGSRTSDLRLYMYNKTLELQEKKTKPYIVAMWEKHGLDIEKVWRVEFSITGFNKSFSHKDTGELALTMKDLDCLEVTKYNMLFKFLYFKKMFFYKTSDVKKGGNVTRDAKRIVLIKEFEGGNNLDWCEIRETEPSGRTEKVLLKKINEHYNELWNKKNDDAKALIYGVSIKTYMDNHIKLYGLESWAHKKLPDYNPHSILDEEDQRSLEEYIFKLIHKKRKVS